MCLQRIALVAIYCAALCLLSTSSYGETVIGGVISSNTSWIKAESPYRITSDVTVMSGATLSIEPGVIVHLESGVNLGTDGGRLLAKGTYGQPVIFTSAKDDGLGLPKPGDWGQLRLSKPASPLAENSLEYVNVKYGKGLNVTNSSPVFSYISVLKNSGAAISIDSRSSPAGVVTLAEGNGLDGVQVSQGDIESSVVWGIKGLPYILSEGVLSIGKSPSITEISPNLIELGETLTVTTRGGRLDLPEKILFSHPGITGILKTGGDSASFPMDVKADGVPPGAYDLEVSTAAGKARLPMALSVIGVKPRISSLVPAKIYAGRSSSLLTLNGSGFSSDVVAALNGVEVQTTLVDAQTLKFSVPTQTPGDKAVAVKLIPGSNSSVGYLTQPITLSVVDPVISLSPVPISLAAGTKSTATIGIPLPAQQGGNLFSLAADPAQRISIPLSVLIPEGATSAQFLVESLNPDIWSDETATIKATSSGFAPATVMVNVAASATIRLSAQIDPNIGASFEVGKPRTITLELNRSAPAGGLLVLLSSSSPGVVSVPQSVLVPANSRTVTFDVNPAMAGSAEIQASTSGFRLGSIPVVAIVVYHEPPKATVSPQPIAIPPTQAAKGFKISLDRADIRENVVTLAVSDTSVASVSPSSITFAVGQREATISVSGLKAGQTALNLTSSTLAPLTIPVYVTADFSGATTGYSPVVGVKLESSSQASTPIDRIMAPAVGVARGSYIESISPRSYLVGSDANTMTVTGRGLGGVTAVKFIPTDGLTVGIPSVSLDGLTVQVGVTVASSASKVSRKVVLVGPAGDYNPAIPDADRIRIDQGIPLVESLEPNFVTKGSANTAVRIRGRNFLGLSGIAITPPDSVTLGVGPSVSADGTEIVMNLAVAADAPAAERSVMVISVAGSSESTLQPANTLHIGSQVQSSVAPLVTPVIGVIRQDGSAPATVARPAYATDVGVVYGKAVASVLPNSGIVGETVQARFTGIGLNGVTSITLSPADGISVGTPVLGPDGAAMSVAFTISADAAKTQRRLVVMSGVERLRFSRPTDEVFLITAPIPKIDSVSPTFLQIGATPVAVTIRGRNFTGADRVQVLPADGLTISVPPVVNGDGTAVTVNMSAAAGAMPGGRVVLVGTPAGDSGTEVSIANTLTLSSNVGPTYGPVSSSGIGVVLQSPPGSDPTVTYPVYSSHVGVDIAQPPPSPTSTNYAIRTPEVGLSLGSVAQNIDVGWLYPGSSGILTVNGSDLSQVSAITTYPVAGITFVPGSLLAAPDGKTVSVAYTVATDAAVGIRDLRLTLTGGARVLFSRAGTEKINIAPGEPSIDSISPVVTNVGNSVSLLIRGNNLQNPVAVSLEPPDSVKVSSSYSVNAAGTELTATLDIGVDAPVGDRVVRVKTWGGVTPAGAQPANTLHIYP